MSTLLLIAGLLQTTGTTQAGLDAGAALVGDVALMSVKPWFGGDWGQFSAGLQGPVRFDIEAGELRERDYDELGDLGRLVRFIDIGNGVVRVGDLSNVTLGNGTIVRRYNNNVDDDHHRSGVRLTLDTPKLAVDAFIDNVFAAPVVAGRVGIRLNEFEVGATFAGDTAAPDAVDGTADAEGNLKAETSTRAVFGFDFRWIASDTPTFKGAVFGDFNAVRTGNPGAHGGLEAKFLLQDRLWFTFVGEGIWFGPQYDWSIFDTNYLIDRWSLKWAAIDEYPSGFGARLMGAFDFDDALKIGVDYANSVDLERSDITAWVRIPHQYARVSAFWRRRFGNPNDFAISLDQTVAAASAGVRLGPFGWLDVTGARMWRVAAKDGIEQYHPFTEGSLILQMLF